jgi:hypothetical protein
MISSSARFVTLLRTTVRMAMLRYLWDRMCLESIRYLLAEVFSNFV